MLAQPVCAGSLVKIQLMNKLDEQRGFRIDIRGHKERAKVQRELQAHTCYSYQSQVRFGQAFDEQLISRCKFCLPAFEVCMEADDSVEGSRLNLGACNDAGAQRSEFTANNQIKLISNDELRVAIDAGASKQGGGGTPIHLLRSLSLANCEKSRTRYTSWRMSNQPSNQAKFFSFIFDLKTFGLTR